MDMTPKLQETGTEGKNIFLARCIFAASAECMSLVYGLTQRRDKAQEFVTRDDRRSKSRTS